MRSLKKRFAALLCAATMVVSGLSVTAPVTAKAEVLNGFSDMGRQVATEGCVLLKNENNVLPLKENSTVSVFGRIQKHYYACGLGSGGGVNTNYRVSILEGLEKSDKVKVNTDLKKTYEEFIKKNPDKGEGNWNTAPWYQEEMPMTKDIAEKAEKNSDTAVIIIGRTSGENRDGAFKKGSYLLTDKEEEMMKIVSETFEDVVVVLNVATIVDMSWVDKYSNIDSVLYVWNGGQDGGHAVADVLTGKVNPSGKLADTIATDYKKYPTYSNYGGDKNLYQEDIYVGYRYFETFAQDDVKYPFGYGLSYTTFETKTNRVVEEDGYIEVVVSVTNTGKVAGREVVQVYYGAPQNKLGNPAKELAAFAKTEKLEPGKSQNISMKFKITDMASYDDSGVTGHESAYVLEAGDYKIYVGNDVRSSKEVYTYKQNELKVVEQLTEAAAPIVDFNRYKAVEKDGKITKTEEKVPKLNVNVEKKIKDNLPKELKAKNDGKTYKLIDVYNKKVTMEEFVAQFENEQIAALTQGGKDVEGSYAKGCASPFGGSQIKDKDGKLTYFSKLYGVPVVTTADGPSGMKVSAKGTLLPCGNLIGCTWDLELIEKLYVLEGKEMLMNGVDNLLGPGINIHRDPRCGRNFEYFSEDPLLSGRLAAAIAKGVQSTGATVTAKHFAANNQECDINGKENRRWVDSVVSERALREIYLKVFEIYVKEGNAQSLMTAYNPINGCWAASNYDLNTEILRNEWGYKGIVMTDWWAQISKYAWADGKTDRDGKYLATMVKAQNDLYMPQDTIYDDKGKRNGKMDNVMDNIKNGYLTRAELQRSAVNLCRFIMNTQSFAKANGLKFEDYAGDLFKPGEDWFKVEQAKLGNPKVSELTVDGRKVTTFNENVSEYKVYLAADATKIPEVKATAENGTTIEVQQATKDNKVAIVKATEQQATIQYRIIFTEEEGVTPVLENAVQASISDIKVNGKTISGFDSGVYKYSVAVDSLEKAPEVVCEAPTGVTAKVTYDATKKATTIQCTSADQARSYELRFGIAPKSDEFNEAKLSDIWTVEQGNETNWKIEDGHLVIGAEYGSIWQDQDHLKNRFIQSAFGDWEVVVKIDLPKLPSQNYQSLGAIAMQDQNNYIYVKMEHGDKVGIALCQEKDGKINTLEALSDDDVAKFTNTMYIKMQKLGTTYIASVSPDGKDYIRFKTSASAEYENPKFMLVNGNGDKELDETLEAKFDSVQFKTEGLGDVVNITDGTKLKVAEVNPIAVSASLKPENCEDTDKGLNLTGSNTGEYIIYNINVEKSGYYDFTARMASAETDTQQVSFTMHQDSRLLTNFFRNGTGGAQNWVDVPGTNAKLTAGTHTLKLNFDNSGLNLNWIQFKLTKEIPDTELRTLVTAAKAKDMSAYSKEDQEAYAAAIKAAEAVLETEETKEAFDAAVAEFKKVEEGLTVPTTPGGNINDGTNPDNAGDKPDPDTKPDTEKDLETLKTELKALVDAEKATIDNGKGEYTDASWAAYEAAYNAAANPAADADATALAKLKDDLEVAKKALAKEGEPAPDSDDKDDLAEIKAAVEKALKEAEAIYKAGGEEYTASSWKNFKVAYETAEETLKDADATVEELKECEEDLIKAQGKLRKKSGTTDDKTDTPTETPDDEAGDQTSNGTQVPNTSQTPNTSQNGATQNDSATKYMDQVKVTVDKTELYYGGDIDNTATVNVAVPNGAAIKQVTYQVSDTKAVTVDAAGKITARGKGEVLVTANVTLTNGETKPFVVKVTAKKAYIEKVKVPATVKRGKKATLKAIVYGSSKNVSWKIKSGSRYAKITKAGKLTAKAKGRVKVQAKAGKISKTFTIRIK